MLKFEQINTKEWNILNNGELVFNLPLLTSTVSNKYVIVTNFVEELSTYYGEDFDNWFIKFLNDSQDVNVMGKVMMKNVPIIKKYVNDYIDYKNINFADFVDESKAKKNSILFVPEEIKNIILMSSYLKLYSFVSNRPEHLGQTQHREVYNEFAKDVIDGEIIRKIYDVIKTKTFRYNLTDKFMWEYIKNVQAKDIGVHVIEIFNFIMNNILILCEDNKNPIVYFISVIDESLKWFMRSVYKGSIVYDDSVATEDIQGSNADSLQIYCFNDTLGRLKSIAYEKVYEILQKNMPMSVEANSIKDDATIISFHERASKIQFISPLCQTVVFPILSKMTSIPYGHFKTLSPEHACIIAVYMQNIFRRVFKSNYKEIISLLNFYPLKSPSINTTYKIKSVGDYFYEINQVKNFYSFDSYIPEFNLIGNFVGKASRIDFCDVLTGKELGGIALSKVESSMVTFFIKYFANKFDDEIAEMTRLMDLDF